MAPSQNLVFALGASIRINTVSEFTYLLSMPAEIWNFANLKWVYFVAIVIKVINSFCTTLAF